MPNPEYTECMRPYMTGKGKSKEERAREMCVGAKICSGKASNRQEAETICDAPKPENPPSKKGSLSAARIAACASPQLGVEEERIHEILTQCGYKAPKKGAACNPNTLAVEISEAIEIAQKYDDIEYAGQEGGEG